MSSSQISDAELAGRIARGAAQLGLTLEPAALARLVAYLRLLEKWSHAYNLTGVREPAEMVPRHVLDSLAVLPYQGGSSSVDVGSGAGLPGIPLAIAEPARRILLVESGGKKARFLEAVRDELALGNVVVEQVRAEDYRPLRRFDTVVSRAVAAAPQLLRVAGHLCRARGRVLMMKGALRPDEFERLPSGWRLQGTHRLLVPGLSAERHVAVLERAGEGESTDAAQVPGHRSR